MQTAPQLIAPTLLTILPDPLPALFTVSSKLTTAAAPSPNTSKAPMPMATPARTPSKVAVRDLAEGVCMQFLRAAECDESMRTAAGRLRTSDVTRAVVAL